MHEREIKDLLVKYYKLLDNPGPYKKTLGYLMQPHEVILLYSLIIKEQPTIIFESGTAMGWSASWMALASDAAVFTFDPINREKIFSPKKTSYIFVNDRFSTIKSRLENSQFRFKRLYFIDGDHTFGGFLEDFQSIENFLNKKDILVLHDTIRERGVVKGLDYIKKKYPNWQYESIDTYNGMEVITIK